MALLKGLVFFIIYLESKFWFSKAYFFSHSGLHFINIPWGVPYNLYIDISNAINPANIFLHITNECIMKWTTPCCHSHFDIDIIIFRTNANAIYESKIYYIYWDLWIHAFPQR